MDETLRVWEEEGWEEEEEEEEESTTEDKVAVARQVIKRMNEEWLQNVFGQEGTDVIFDALQAYIEQQHMIESVQRMIG